MHKLDFSKHAFVSKKDFMQQKAKLDLLEVVLREFKEEREKELR